jgi:group I intron endonuclease
MRTGVIYLITNTTNGKLYVGQTIKKLERRWNLHRSTALRGRSSQALHRAIVKYGAENFIIEVLIEIPEDQLDSHEIRLIEQYDSMNPLKGYNMTPGGGGTGSGSDNHRFGKTGHWADNPYPDEARAKLRAASIKVRGPHSEITKRRISNAHLGKVLSSDVRARVSATARAKNPNPSPMALEARRYRDRKRARALAQVA